MFVLGQAAGWEGCPYLVVVVFSLEFGLEMVWIGLVIWICQVALNWWFG